MLEEIRGFHKRWDKGFVVREMIFEDKNPNARASRLVIGGTKIGMFVVTLKCNLECAQLIDASVKNDARYEIFNTENTDCRLKKIDETTFALFTADRERVGKFIILTNVHAKNMDTQAILLEFNSPAKELNVHSNVDQPATKRKLEFSKPLFQDEDSSLPSTKNYKFGSSS